MKLDTYHTDWRWLLIIDPQHSQATHDEDAQTSSTVSFTKAWGAHTTLNLKERTEPRSNFAWMTIGFGGAFLFRIMRHFFESPFFQISIALCFPFYSLMTRGGGLAWLVLLSVSLGTSGRSILENGCWTNDVSLEFITTPVSGESNCSTLLHCNSDKQ